MSAAVGRLRLRGGVDLPDYPRDVAWSPDARALVVGLANGMLMHASVEDLQRPRRLEAHQGAVLALAWQKAGRLWASSGEDGAVLLWEARTATSRRIHQSSQWSERLNFSDNSRWLAVATGRTLSLFDAQGEAQYRARSAGGAIAALAWRPRSGEIATAGNGGVLLHRPPPQGAVRELPIRGACVTAAFNPDGRLLAAGMQEGAVHLWNIATGTQSQMAGYALRVSATEWSANGRYLATAAGSTLAIWDFSGKGPEGSAPLTLEGHSERVTSLCFRPVGTWLASVARDRRLLWWRLGAGDAPHDAHLLGDECSALRFSPNGAHLAVCEARGKLMVYDCEP